MEVLTYPGLNPINWANPPKATTRVSSDYICTDGVRLTGSLRTVCHQAWLMDQAAKKGLVWQVIQPPFNTGVPASAGTHDLDVCADGRLLGLDWPQGQTWLRKHGFDCWWRHTGSWASPSAFHFHGFTHPNNGWTFDTKVGIFVPGQLLDYKNHAFGLAGQHVPGSDHSWFPPDPHAVAFNLAKFIRNKQEDLMEYKDWSKESRKQMASDVADELLARGVSVRTPTNDGFEKVTVKQAIGRAANSPALIRDKSADISGQIKDIDSNNA